MTFTITWRLATSCLLFVAMFARLPAHAETTGPQFSNENPRIVAAYAVKTKLEASDQIYAASTEQLIDALDQAIARIPINPLQSDFRYERQSLEQLIRITEALIHECDSVMKAQVQYLEAGQTYSADLSKARPAFEAAAAECRAAAKAVQYSDNRRDCEVMADIMTAMAARCSQFPTEIASRNQAINELSPYLAEGRAVLVMFNGVLRATPIFQKSDPLLDDRLKSYVARYESFRGSLRKLHEHLQPANKTLASASQLRSTSPLRDTNLRQWNRASLGNFQQPNVHAATRLPAAESNSSTAAATLRAFSTQRSKEEQRILDMLLEREKERLAR